MNTPTVTGPDAMGDYITQHCYICERPITAQDALVRNGGVQVIIRYGLRAHRRCWLERYGGPKEEQGTLDWGMGEEEGE